MSCHHSSYFKKNDLKPHLQKMWCIGKINAEFIARMEQILQLYGLQPDEKQPLVCFDEKSYQVLGDTIAPIPMQPGKPARYSEKYLRHGTHQVFVAYMPLIGKRFVWVNPTRKAVDFAFFFKYFMEHYLPTVCPEYKCVRVVMDNLNTHTTASFYKAFDPQTALELANKVQFYFTPVNASWLNIAEIEIHAISVQCLHRRMKEQKTVSTEIQTLVQDRNDNCIKTNWQFSIPDAREKFQRFYADLY